MGKRRTDADRFLNLRNGNYQYHRSVPASVGQLDSRWPKVRISLKTEDIAVARIKRDKLETEDDALWSALLTGDDPDSAMARYKAAVRTVEALGFQYRTTAQLLANGLNVPDILARLTAIENVKPGSPVERAVLGLIDEPVVTVADAFDIYVKEVMPSELVGKSDTQKYDWQKIKRRAVNNFIEVVGNVAISDITREQARKFYQFWLGRIAPERSKPTHSPSSGNRDIGNMRQLFREYHAHIGQGDRQNPFDGLAFAEKVKRSRPPFAVDWIRKEFLGSDKLLGLNPEARGIVLMMIETGARPSEIANLGADNIVLNAPVPYISIEPRVDPDDPREIKTGSSVRQVPLVGVALEVAKTFPSGFPRYWNKERTLSNTLNKALDANGLLPKPAPSPAHSAYSLRHSFEDRMKEAKVDEELRRALMGHTIDRPKYGEGGSLKLKQDALLTMALPFDPAIVRAGQVRAK